MAVLSPSGGPLHGCSLWEQRPRGHTGREKLGWIEPETLDLARTDRGPEIRRSGLLRTGHEHVPIVVRAVQKRIDGKDTRGTSVVHPIEKQQIDIGRTPGKDREVRAAVRQRSSQRMLRPVAGAATRFSATACSSQRITTVEGFSKAFLMPYVIACMCLTLAVSSTTVAVALPALAR